MTKKILLADDSITIQKVVELTFAEGDYEVICASDGSQAIRKIEESEPDIALVDVMMPQANGYEVCAHVKKDPNLAWIPVLLLTGTFEPFDPRRADQVGANGHIVKPFESRSLVAQVEDLMARHPRPGAEKAPEPEHAPIEPSRVTGQAVAVNAGQMFAPKAGAMGEAGARSTPVDQGPSTVRMDSRDFLSPFSGGEALETPAAVEPPSLGALDLAASRNEEETTQSMKIDRNDSNRGVSQPESAPGLTAEEVERIARERVEEIARPLIREAVEKVIREIAWEVIPDTAEALVRRRLKELEDEAGEEPTTPPLH